MNNPLPDEHVQQIVNSIFDNTQESIMGHSAGDKLLNIMARRIQSCVRSYDTIAGWGGDEFVIVLTDLKQNENAESVANKILNMNIGIVAEGVEKIEHLNFLNEQHCDPYRDI